MTRATIQRSVSIRWRDAIRDSELDATAKLVAFVLSTYLNGSGRARPSQETLARGCSLSDRAVGYAVERIEQAGFLNVERASGRANRYHVVFPEAANVVRGLPANVVRGSEPEPANLTTRTGEPDDKSGEPRSDEDGLKRTNDDDVVVELRELLDRLGGYSPPYDDVVSAWNENPDGVRRLVENARRGKNPAGLLTTLLRVGAYRGSVDGRDPRTRAFQWVEKVGIAIDDEQDARAILEGFVHDPAIIDEAVVEWRTRRAA